MTTIHDFNWALYGSKDIYLDWRILSDFSFDDVMNWFYGNEC